MSNMTLIRIVMVVLIGCVFTQTYQLHRLSQRNDSLWRQLEFSLSLTNECQASTKQARQIADQYGDWLTNSQDLLIQYAEALHIANARLRANYQPLQPFPADTLPRTVWHTIRENQNLGNK